MRLPETLPAALAALEADAVIRDWLPPPMLATFLGIRRAELARLADTDAAALCAAYRALY